MSQAKELVLKDDDIVRVAYPAQFEQIDRIRGNRPVNEYHVMSLEEAIKEKAKRKRKGFSMFLLDPIKLNMAGRVMDGQHRLALAIRLQLPIKYVVESGNLTDVIALNSGRRNWTLNNFLEAYIERGNKDYMLIKQFCEEAGLPISSSLKLLGSKDVYVRKHAEMFKAGTFEMGDYEFACKVGRYIQDYRLVIDETIVRSNAFCQAIRYIYEVLKVDHNRMKKNLQNMRKINYISAASISGHLRQLERIYNHYVTRNAVRFDIDKKGVTSSEE